MGIDRTRLESAHKICIAADVDRQHTLPFGTTEEVRRLLKDIIQDFRGQDGCLILYGEIGPDVPLKNAESMLKALQDYGELVARARGTPGNGLLNPTYQNPQYERRLQFGYTVFLTTILDSSIFETNNQPRSKYASNSRISISTSSERPKTSPTERARTPSGASFLQYGWLGCSWLW